MELRAVEDKRGLADFVRVPWAVYNGDPNWVPPLVMERKSHLSRENPYFRHAEARYFVAYRDGTPIGRVSAQVDRLAVERTWPPTGHFGLLEAAEDSVVPALMEAAEKWLSERGMARVQGPFSLSINDECGLLVEGFATPPRMLMNYAPRRYAEALAAAGYEKAKDIIAYRYDMANPYPPTAQRLADHAASDPRVGVRTLDPKRFRDDLGIIVDIFNDAWAENWGFVPMTAEEVEYTAKNLKPLIRHEIALIAEMDGEPAAMIVALPDLHEAIADLDGRLLPIGWSKLLWRLKVRGLKSARVVMMGVRQRYRQRFLSSALSALLVARLRENCRAIGVREAELSWILEDNHAMCRLIETVGGVYDKRYRIFQKALT